MKEHEYLNYLQKKEAKILFYIKSVAFTHGHVSTYIRTAKGMLLGFGIGNILIQKVSLLPWYAYPLILLAAVFFSALLIHYEKRHYKREGHRKTSRKVTGILLACALISPTVLMYSSFTSMILVLSIMTFFASLTYSRE
jgi:hypothetical protein